MSSLPLPSPRLRRSLESLSSRIEDPALKLQFIRKTLANYEVKPRFLRETPGVRGAVLHYAAVETLAQFADPSAGGDLRGRALLLLYRARYPVLAVLIVATGILGYEAGRLAYRGTESAIERLARIYLPSPPTPPFPASIPTTVSTRSADGRLGPAPEEVWLVKADEEGELWSNGLRVLTAYESTTGERRYFVFPRYGVPAPREENVPVGIVYHTSENDIAPFRSDFNREILRTTRGLLGWLRKRNLYNYFIDRFGQVYRLVVDSHVADHAGVSVWADEEHHYFNLSDSFLGVCFESRWDPRADGIEILTPAQIQAALNLTDMLRSRYGISDRNCVPHGLVSVNPNKMLIGYHLDWAKGFPFEALGLANKYDVPLPSMVDFGFGYDEHLVQTLGGDLWPGIERAEAELRKAAAEEGVPLPVLESRLRARYRREVELLELSFKDRRAAAGRTSSGSR